MIPLLALLLAAPPFGDVVRLAGKGGIGSACPIEGGYLVTNAHMAQSMWSMRWSDGRGNEGTAEFARVFDDADWALLKVTRGKVGREFRIAVNPPAIGDRVYVRGYRSDGRKNVLGERRVSTRVTQREAGHIVFEDDGKPGSSGSCVFNDSGEVVAINAAGLGQDEGNERAGWAVGVWGEWAQALKAAQ